MKKSKISKTKIREIIEKYAIPDPLGFNTEIWEKDFDKLEKELQEYMGDENEKYHEENKPWNCL